MVGGIFAGAAHYLGSYQITAPIVVVVDEVYAGRGGTALRHDLPAKPAFITGSGRGGSWRPYFLHYVGAYRSTV